METFRATGFERLITISRPSRALVTWTAMTRTQGAILGCEESEINEGQDDAHSEKSRQSNALPTLLPRVSEGVSRSSRKPFGVNADFFFFRWSTSIPFDPRSRCPGTPNCDAGHRPLVLKYRMIRSYNDCCDQSSSSLVAVRVPEWPDRWSRCSGRPL